MFFNKKTTKMFEKILFIALISTGLSLMSCSYPSNKMQLEKTENLESKETVEQDKDQAAKLIEKYERRGIKFTKDQKDKINDIVDEIGMGDDTSSLDTKKQLRRKIRSKIEEQVLTAEQKKLIKKKNK